MNARSRRRPNRGRRAGNLRGTCRRRNGQHAFAADALLPSGSRVVPGASSLAGKVHIRKCERLPRLLQEDDLARVHIPPDALGLCVADPQPIPNAARGEGSIILLRGGRNSGLPIGPEFGLAGPQHAVRRHRVSGLKEVLGAGLQLPPPPASVACVQQPASHFQRRWLRALFAALQQNHVVVEGQEQGFRFSSTAHDATGTRALAPGLERDDAAVPVRQELQKAVQAALRAQQKRFFHTSQILWEARPARPQLKQLLGRDGGEVEVAALRDTKASVSVSGSCAEEVAQSSAGGTSQGAQRSADCAAMAALVRAVARQSAWVTTATASHRLTRR
eukprot:scaffold2998_cov239-Pinguiococcus_pyrenoidosus.AAC.4